MPIRSGIAIIAVLPHFIAISIAWGSSHSCVRTGIGLKILS
jgi:hypothetical protein